MHIVFMNVHFFSYVTVLILARECNDFVAVIVQDSVTIGWSQPLQTKFLKMACQPVD